MKLLMNMLTIASAVLLLMAGCSQSKKQSYDDILTDAGAKFESGDYAAALELYMKARDKNSDLADAYSGMGWCYMKLDDLASANTAFETGATKTDPSAELFAGWSFVLNALKDYAGSNTQAAQALVLDAQWQFHYNSDLTAATLHALRAANFVALGDWVSAKNEVIMVDSSFTADVTTDSGKRELTLKIEDLLSLAKIGIYS